MNRWKINGPEAVAKTGLIIVCGIIALESAHQKWCGEAPYWSLPLVFQQITYDALLFAEGIVGDGWLVNLWEAARVLAPFLVPICIVGAIYGLSPVRLRWLPFILIIVVTVGLSFAVFQVTGTTSLPREGICLNT